MCHFSGKKTKSLYQVSLDNSLASWASPALLIAAPVHTICSAVLLSFDSLEDDDGKDDAVAPGDVVGLHLPPRLQPQPADVSSSRLWWKDDRQPLRVLPKNYKSPKKTDYTEKIQIINCTRS